MSVAFLTAQELGVFAGIAHKVAGLSLSDAISTAELISRSNAAAYAAQYNDPAESFSADDIEREALHALAKPDGLMGHFGPCVYNCVTNAGRLYVGELPADANEVAKLILDEIAAIEKTCRKWQEAELRRIERQRENDAAFAEVGPLPILSAEELSAKCRAAGCERIIVARFGVNESDSMSDYFGGRIAREVVIGFGKGKRENFRQLREAAARFEPTTHLGPGCDQWRVRVFTQPDQGATHYRESIQEGPTFTTEAEAEAWIQAEISKPFEQQSSAGSWAHSYGYRLDRESVEHRENWSMGGGNYLGTSRYGGWKVTSRTEAGTLEFFEAPTKQAATLATTDDASRVTASDPRILAMLRTLGEAERTIRAMCLAVPPGRPSAADAVAGIIRDVIAWVIDPATNERP